MTDFGVRWIGGFLVGIGLGGVAAGSKSSFIKAFDVALAEEITAVSDGLSK